MAQGDLLPLIKYFRGLNRNRNKNKKKRKEKEKVDSRFPQVKKTPNDQVRQFLISLFRVIEWVYSFEVLEETFQDFIFEREAERLLEQEAEREIEERNDF